MAKELRSTRIVDYFQTLEDPRRDRNKRHTLIDILVVTIVGVLCGAEGWEEIELYGREKEAWLRKYLELPHGIPSHDTLRRVFLRLKPEELQRCFQQWVEVLRGSCEEDIVAIDGKTVRGSGDEAKRQGPLHLVSAWSQESRLVLGQVKTKEKSNEITAIPQLLDLLELKGCIVTIDAMGCQKDISTKIKKEKKAEYVFAVKENQPKLWEDIRWFYQDLDLEKDVQAGFADHEHTVDKDHGRLEVRDYYISEELDWLKPALGDWTGIKSIGMVVSRRRVKGKESMQKRDYLSSLPADAQQFARAVRSHWGIENSLHWVLDVEFREDSSRLRAEASPENMSILRKIALNLVRRDLSSKLSLHLRRRKAGLNNDYLEKLLFAPLSSFPPRAQNNV